ncbi:amino acid ABC transporter permease [Atopobium sp. oral taxon 810]|uniref:amino acid ABC transporter permease n=1 Tax=Atopobium sp. oral taxon 810 TaxID=712158 RepID=UPI0003960E8C|nr:amino acid ABC transporter permease [Atopobium sp. oral taxon 810]ERI04975.1 ABC transporter, permease protein [Atopobium sp. oral taxon 810 str. F0209]
MDDSHTQGRFRRLRQFVQTDHRYVVLATSVIALIGLWFSMQPRSQMSFLAPVYALELLMYYLLVAWLIFAAAALMTKLAMWHNYTERSPFARKPLVTVERFASYVVAIIAAVLFIDRAVMGVASSAATAIGADKIPRGGLEAALYMLYEGRALFRTGILTTVELAVFGTIIAFFLALLMATLHLLKIDRADNDLVRFFKVVGSGFAKLYSTIVRGTPMMVQALIIYNAGFAVLLGTGMSSGQIRLVWSTFIAGLVTVSLNSTAYMMEVLRGGIESVDAGQTEAARSLGLSQWQTLLRVVFPQGIKFAIPGLSNELVINIKDSSVLSVIGVVELMYESRAMAGIYYKNIEVYMVAAVFYLILTALATYLLNRLSKHLDAPRLQQTSDSIHAAVSADKQ